MEVVGGAVDAVVVWCDKYSELLSNEVAGEGTRRDGELDEMSLCGLLLEGA